jgi:hypothetical protein
MQIAFEDRGMIVGFNESSVLLIADLHLGFEKDLEERGVEVPSQHGQMITRIENLVRKHSVSTLYIVGDVKHSIFPDVSYNWETIPSFMEALAELTDIVIIPGNHDGDLETFLPRSVQLEAPTGISVSGSEERLGVLHGHAWPSIDVLEADVIVCGHNHPVIRRLKDASVKDLGRGGRIRSGRTVPAVVRSRLDRNCVKKHLRLQEDSDESHATLVTLPTFNELFRGVAVNSPESIFYGPLYENECVSLEDSQVLSTTGIFLGDVSWLRGQFNEMIKSRQRSK